MLDAQQFIQPRWKVSKFHSLALQRKRVNTLLPQHLLQVYWSIKIMIWKSLQLSTSAADHLTPLLISTIFTKDGYTIHLTDLTYLWSESLDQGAIIRRSREEATSIDLSDVDQFQIFLDKIKLGLGGTGNTTLALTINADPSDRPSLVLNISVNLPGGLAPLRWPIRLAASPQVQFTNHLTVSLLEAQHRRMQEIASLADVLKEKDHVIQKLLDKLETQGTVWGQIFPQAAGRKVDRKKAEERVRGMSTFDMERWRSGLNFDVPHDTAQLIRSVFTDGNFEVLPAEGRKTFSEEQDTWWQSIKGITVNLGTGRISTNGPIVESNPKPVTRPMVTSKESTDDEDGAFQTQELPPHLIVAKPTLAKDDGDNTTEDDDDDLDGPYQRSKLPEKSPFSPSPAVSLSAVTRKLGKIGGNKAPKSTPPQVEDSDSTDDEDNKTVQKPAASRDKALRKPSPIPVDDESTEDESDPVEQISPKKAASPIPEMVAPKQIKKLGKLGGKKEASPLPLESESESEPDRKRTPVLAKAIEAPKPRAKLGKIGAKKKFVEPEATTTIPQEQSPRPEPSSPTPKKKTLGTIAHAHRPAAEEKAESSATADEDIQERGRASTKPVKENTPELRETSTERADRRRLELKRQMEAKAKAPVKKKRKF
jgi:hypothetical protein